MLKKVFIFSFFLLLNVSDAECSYSVNPRRFEGTIKPGNTYDNHFIIQNFFQEPLKLEISWVDQTDAPLAADWFTLKNNSIEIPAGASAPVDFSIAIPEGARGGYYARVLFSQQSDLPNAITIRYSNPIYIIVPGTEEYGLEIENVHFKTDQSVIGMVFIKNTGNVHIRPSGSLLIESTDAGNVTKTFSLNENERPVLPGQPKAFNIRFSDNNALPDGTYKATAKMNLPKDQGAIQATYTTTFEIKNGTLVVPGHDVNVESK